MEEFSDLTDLNEVKMLCILKCYMEAKGEESCHVNCYGTDNQKDVRYLTVVVFFPLKFLFEIFETGSLYGYGWNETYYVSLELRDQPASISCI